MPGLSPLALEFTAAGQAVDFGVMPRLNNLSSISVSAWIYQDTDPGVGAFYAIADSGGGGMGWYLTAVKDKKLRYDHAGDPGSTGAWTTSANAITLGAYTHVGFSRTNTPTTNAPTMVINGSAVAATGSAQVGANPDETAATFMIGNLKNNYVNYTWTFDGKILDVRVYNRILTSAEWTAIYNGGTPSMLAGPHDYDVATHTGLVFQPFAVQTGELSTFTNQNINGLKVRDAQFGAVGEVIGNVTGRAAP